MRHISVHRSLTCSPRTFSKLQNFVNIQYRTVFIPGKIIVTINYVTMHIATSL